MRLSPWTIARSPLQVQDLFFRQRHVDPLGVRIHTALAVVACLLAAFPTTPLEWAALPLLAAFLIRMTEHHRVLRPLWLDPVVWLLAAWAALICLSFFYTHAAPRSWLGDAQSLRFAVLILALYPVLDRRRWLIAALLISFALGQSVQLAHALNLTSIQRLPGRISGWWDPVVGGSLLCAALGMHLAGSLLSTTRPARFLGTLGALAALLGILATGSRGAWIAAVLTICIAALIALLRLPSRQRAGPLLAGLALVSIAAAAVWLTPPVRARLDQGIAETRAALEDSRFTTDTGLRVAMARWAIAEFRAHPILGVGAGGYQSWAAAQTSQRARELDAPPRARTMLHAHAHNWYLHTLATTGLLGASLLFSALILAIRSGLRGPRDGPPPSGYDAAPPLGLVGLAAAGLFDTITINQQTAFLFFMLMALCLSIRPRALGEPTVHTPPAPGAPR